VAVSRGSAWISTLPPAARRSTVIGPGHGNSFMSASSRAGARAPTGLTFRLNRGVSRCLVESGPSGLGVAGHALAETGPPGPVPELAAGTGPTSDRGGDRPYQPGVDRDAFRGGGALHLLLQTFRQPEGDPRD